MVAVSAIKIALRAVRQNKMRSALTMLGIIIGVGAVITMIAVGEGASRSLAREIASMGTNILRVYPGSGSFGGVRVAAGELTTLKEEDASAIRSEVPEVTAVAPIARGSSQVVYGNANWFTSIVASTSDFGVAREWGAASGRYFTVQEEDGAAKVCLIGKTVVDSLFFGEDPIGKSIRIKRVPFTVIGILEEKGQSPIGRDQDDVVIVPLRTGQRRIFGVTHISDMWVKVGRQEDLPMASEKIEILIRQRHHIPEGGEDDFTVRNLTEVLGKAAEANRIMSILLGSVAAVSLLVGGIGIMNIMLVSVTERTREIGIRMAVGARERDILMQFLIEAVVLSIIGGIAGMLFGALATRGVASFAGWDTYISLGSILLAFGFSAGIGIFFGFYPARKAAMLDPIDALRYE